MKQILRVRLIRHGEKRLFMPDPSLTKLGQDQAQEMAQKLKPKLENKNCLLLASPTRRTQETAQALAQALDLDLKIDQSLYLDDLYAHNAIGHQALLKYFQDQAIDGVEELLLVTHSQNIRDYWQVLGGPDQAINDIKECGVWTIILDGEKVSFEYESNF